MLLEKQEKKKKKCMLFIGIFMKFKVVSECSNANFENTKYQPYLLGVMLQYKYKKRFNTENI